MRASGAAAMAIWRACLTKASRSPNFDFDGSEDLTIGWNYYFTLHVNFVDATNTSLCDVLWNVLGPTRGHALIVDC